MKPIYFSISPDKQLMIIPDSEAHADGHPVLTYTYSIYHNRKDDVRPYDYRETNLHLEKNADPDYLGYITFEQPGKLFSYSADGQQDLSSDEVQDIIAAISQYRDTPSMWSI